MTDKAQLPLCLFGAGGHGAGVAAQIHRATGTWPVFADDAAALGTMVGGTTVLFGCLEDVQDHQIIVTIGSSAGRRAVQHSAAKLGLPLATFIASPATYFGKVPGAGSISLAGTVVNAGAVLEEGVIVNNGAVLEHGCVVGAFSHIAPGAVVAGGAMIGADVWIGANATVLQDVHICDGTTIGAGAVVTRDVEEPGTYVGQPARRVRD